MTERESTLKTPDGTLHHVSVAPPASPIARILIIHGYGEHIGRHRHFMHWLARHGIASNGIDLRGQGKSTGRRGFVREWTDYLSDIDAIFSALPTDAPIFLLGHSHGSLVQLKFLTMRGVGMDVAARPAVRGAVFVSPFFGNAVRVPPWKLAVAHLVDPFTPWLAMRTGLLAEQMTSDPTMIEESRIDPLLTRVATPRWFLRMRQIQNEVATLAPHLPCDSLVLTGSADRIIDLSAAAAFRAAAPNVTSREYPGMKHELLRERGREIVFNDILNWLTARAGA
jgi:lysophospholipase